MAESPVWKKPCDVMKIHSRRKSVSQKKITVCDQQRTNVIYRSPSKPIKRRNPFNCEDDTAHVKKKRHFGDVREPANVSDGLEDCALFNILDRVEKDISTNDSLSIPPQDIVNPEIERKFENKKKNNENGVVQHPATTGPVREVSATLPMDWCLKTKLRVVSSSTLSWCTQLKSADEAHGIASYVQGTPSQLETSANEKRDFQRNCLYWIHPNIPWVRLFPRIVESKSKCFSQLMQDDVQASLQADWEESFTSAFHLFRSGLCPYFYLCTHQFTVLFCCEHETQSSMVAMVTPTTRGFRELIKNEGIDFTLPVGEKQQLPHSETTGVDDRLTSKVTPAGDANLLPEKTRCDDDADDDDLLDTDDAASGWLESMGLDKKQFPSLDPNKVKLQREAFRVIDHRPESLVLVRGGDVQALFNFLLNCRTCTATSGPQAGVPPTILAPHAFKGGVLKSHRVKHTVVRQADRDGNISHAHIVEVTGPILPQHTHSLVALFHRTQAADFGMAFSNHDQTMPFNVITSPTGTVDVSSDGVTDRETSQSGDNDNLCGNKYFERKVIDSGRVCAVKEIVCSREGFTWSS